MLGLYILGVSWQRCTGDDPPATALGSGGGFWREDAGGRWSRQREVMITRGRGGVRKERGGGVGQVRTCQLERLQGKEKW